MRHLITLLLLAVIIEKAVELIKDICGKKINGRILRAISFIISILATFIIKIGILNLLNILPSNSNQISLYFDYFLTAAIISRGSNVLHDIMTLFEKLNDKLEIKKRD